MSLLGPLEGMSAQDINLRFQQIITADEFGYQPLPDDTFSTLMQELYRKPRLFTYVDLFCGAGGSSIGLTAAGGELIFAANHSKRAVETHSANFSNAEHECADLDHYDYRKIPCGADVLWASPICTELSPAGGRKRRKRRHEKGFQAYQEELLKLGPVKSEDFIRTRATFLDIISAVGVHSFKYVIVENVVDAALDWDLFGWWLDGMALRGYTYQILCVSSAHVGGPLNPHAPQRRDRLYIVFTRRDMVVPDISVHPLSKCDTCGDVEGYQWWKRPEGTLTESGRYFLVGKYGKRSGQYVYRCPNSACKNSVVTPYERPAAQIIDWSDLGTRICDRPADDPLAPSTMRRIERGLAMFGPAALINSAHDDDRAYPPGAHPFPARTAKIGDGLATGPQPWLDSNGGSWNTEPASIHQPFRARTTKEWEALVIPPGASIVTLRNNVNPTSPWEALTSINAGGNHHGLVVPYNRTGVARHTRHAMPTQTTKDRTGLALPDLTAPLDVQLARYRMIQWHEQARAQRFPVFYTITGNQGEKTAQAGNAVSANVAQHLGERVAAALNKTACNGA